MPSRTRNTALATSFALALCLLALAAPTTIAGQPLAEQPDAGAVADLVNARGDVVGAASFTRTAAGVQIALHVAGLPPGEHGLHLHEVGTCDPPDFATAGAHFNPRDSQHGLRNPFGPHAGDLPNLPVGSDGAATVAITTNRVTLDPGEGSLFDDDGSALVIHEAVDDQMSDPAGNSGGRLVCGVVRQAAR